VERLLERCAALDVHQASVSACVRVPGERDQRREFNERFGTTTPDLLALPTHGSLYFKTPSKSSSQNEDRSLLKQRRQQPSARNASWMSWRRS
jgi:hypothetical protein